MENLNKIIIYLIVVVGIILVITNVDTKSNILGQATDESYNSTTTNSTWNNTAGCWRLIKSGFGTLHTVNLNLTHTNSRITLYDATTTVNGGIYGTTTLAEFGPSAVAGSYTFKNAFARGLVADVSNNGSCASISSSTITYK